MTNDSQHLWKVGQRMIDFSQRGMIMGVLNVTPDSFSDGGEYFEPEVAVEHGLEMVEQGAEIIDIGGESTRPNAEEVAIEEEIRRTIPVIELLRNQTNALISIDTSKAEVAKQALDAGADIINDVAGFRGDGMLELAADSHAGLVAMHMQGNPRTMQKNPQYSEVVEDVRQFFLERLETLKAAGVDQSRIMFDPGIGFGKTVPQNLDLLANLEVLRSVGRPLLIGVSRKSFISKVLDDQSLEAREWPTVALTGLIRKSGAAVLRVHDVRPNVDAMRMVEAIMGAG